MPPDNQTRLQLFFFPIFFYNYTTHREKKLHTPTMFFQLVGFSLIITRLTAKKKTFTIYRKKQLHDVTIFFTQVTFFIAARQLSPSRLVKSIFPLRLGVAEWAAHLSHFFGTGMSRGVRRGRVRGVAIKSEQASWLALPHVRMFGTPNRGKEV